MLLRLLVSLPLAAAVFSGQAPLPERLESWQRDFERRGDQVVVVRVETERETNRIRIPSGIPHRELLARYLGSEPFVAQFIRTHAMTVNQQTPGGRVHFILLNTARADEWKGGEEALLAHEFGHAWLDLLGFRGYSFFEESSPCLAVHSSDIVQHVLIREELDARRIPFRDYWTGNLERALAAMKSGAAAPAAGPCDTLARVALWTDVRLGLTPRTWSRSGEFDRAFRQAFPELAPAVDELVTVLQAVDVTAVARFQRALAYVQQRLATLTSP